MFNIISLKDLGCVILSLSFLDSNHMTGIMTHPIYPSLIYIEAESKMDYKEFNLTRLFENAQALRERNLSG
jgi:hypothetical protein